MNPLRLSRYIEKIFETPSRGHSEWFGYYNYDVLSAGKDKILCNRAEFDGVAPEKGMKIQLGYYVIPSGEWHQVGETDSWNWQQGAMMQWLPDDRVIYNSSKDNHLISRIFDPSTGKTEDINWPIYGLTPDGKKSIALEMERSRWCRAYHYKSVENRDLDGLVARGDGIFEINLERKSRKRIIDIRDVIAADADSDFGVKKHWLEHIMVSPGGTRFCFLHRFSAPTNVSRYTTRLCVAEIDGGNLQIIPGWRTRSWSHFGWKSEEEFAIYTVTQDRFGAGKGLRQTLKSGHASPGDICGSLLVGISYHLPYPLAKFLSGRRKYYEYYSVENGIFVKKGEWEAGLLNIDGHPSFTADGRYMVTDSYPDSQGWQRLIVYDTVAHKGLLLARLYAYYRGTPASCDLHPKLSRDNDFIALDSAYDDTHHLILFKLDWEAIKKKISE